MPTFTAPNGNVAPGKTFPPRKAEPGTSPSVPINGLTYLVKSVMLLAVVNVLSTRKPSSENIVEANKPLILQLKSERRGEKETWRVMSRRNIDIYPLILRYKGRPLSVFRKIPVAW